MTPILIEIEKNNSLDAKDYTFYKREMKNIFNKDDNFMLLIL